ncbi:hypothetical protein B0H13DRAFT_2309715 [Mycena leptocephala]|nr:hypothetical protein B0H13DRAFT_2309715 [Mycena leptocephala]
MSTHEKSANDGDSDPVTSTMHMYPFAPGLSSQSVRSNRRQVKNACTNCQKACKKRDEARPCLRCVKYKVPEECIDSQRKERERGAKRGPYKKRDGRGNRMVNSDDPSQGGHSQAPAAPLVEPILVGYTPAFYWGPGEPEYHPRFHPETCHYPPPHLLPPTFMAPYLPPYPPYMMRDPGGQTVPHSPGPRGCQ